MSVDKTSNLVSLDPSHLRKPHVAYDLDRIPARRAFMVAVADEIERLQAASEAQVQYAIKLQRLIEAYSRGRELPYPELHHHRMLAALRAGETSCLQEEK